jgi:hypothetical protein
MEWVQTPNRPLDEEQPGEEESTSEEQDEWRELTVIYGGQEIECGGYES